MSRFTSLRARLVGVVLVAITPVWILLCLSPYFWVGFLVGLLALVGAWLGSEFLVLRQVRSLLSTARQIGAGDLSARTGMSEESGELGDLARQMDSTTQKLSEGIKQCEEANTASLNRSLQQGVVSALGQFALLNMDVPALLNQVGILVSQTLEVEYCGVLKLAPDGESLALTAGMGWKGGMVGKLFVPLDADTEVGTAWGTGEPVVLEDIKTERRFRTSGFLAAHGVISGITVRIPGEPSGFGILGAYTARPRRFTGDEVNFLLSIATVVSMAADRVRSEAGLQQLAAFAQLNPNPVMELDSGANLTYSNDAARKLSLSVGEESPETILPPNIAEIVQSCQGSGRSKVGLTTTLKGRTLSWSFHPVPTGHVVHAYVEDVTDKLSLQAQLLQSQKMESVGQLAAGVAHDFNNMLTVIQGHSGMLLARPSLPSEVRESVQAISFAAERAGSLTRQLLLFSRKGLMEVKPLNLAEVVDQLSKLLQRVLSEHVRLEVHNSPQLPTVHGDPGMIEQVLMNLAVNARDAMPGGGKLTVSTLVVDVSEDYVATHPEARPGPFVCLRVADNGCGMDAATKERAFEPFFTTKPVGKGTGLGLATVYGIVKQHHGWVELESEVGKGTTFHVFLPSHGGEAPVAEPKRVQTGELTGGSETILVVEDEPILRSLALAILEHCGYRVIEAVSGPDALKVWELEGDSVDLLLTDLVMPEGISGADLAGRLRESKPSLKVVFTTGYSIEEMDPALFAEGKAKFLQKPYTHISLARTVRQCLDA